MSQLLDPIYFLYLLSCLMKFWNVDHQNEKLLILKPIGNFHAVIGSKSRFQNERHAIFDWRLETRRWQSFYSPDSRPKKTTGRSKRRMNDLHKDMRRRICFSMQTKSVERLAGGDVCDTWVVCRNNAEVGRKGCVSQVAWGDVAK